MDKEKCLKNIRKPDWLRLHVHNTSDYAQVSSLVKEHGLHTICSSGMCPNKSECWSLRRATFMIAGDICTRKCRFCATKSGRPLPLDENEPVKIARSVKVMGLRHAVITSVDRDDLEDLGVNHWIKTVEEVKRLCPDTSVEILIPDFQGRHDILDRIVTCGADIFGHNIETVRRLTPVTRSRATYDCSLDVLRYLREKGAETKSGLMVGLGETFDEVVETLSDLYAAGVRRVTIGQYLQPSKQHLEVAEFVIPETFDLYGNKAREIGFTHVASAPLVRSSYLAEL